MRIVILWEGGQGGGSGEGMPRLQAVYSARQLFLREALFGGSG